MITPAYQWNASQANYTRVEICVLDCEASSTSSHIGSSTIASTVHFCYVPYCSHSLTSHIAKHLKTCSSLSDSINARWSSCQSCRIGAIGGSYKPNRDALRDSVQLQPNFGLSIEIGYAMWPSLCSTLACSSVSCSKTRRTGPLAKGN